MRRAFDAVYNQQQQAMNFCFGACDECAASHQEILIAMCHFDALLSMVETRISRDTAPMREHLPSLMKSLANLAESRQPSAASSEPTAERLFRGRTGELYGMAGCAAG